jgi:putative transposase
MPRANRYFIPGQIWHITQRCHNKEFLLKFKRDRERWLYWLFEAKKRFGLTILNYMVTSNHIHLLVEDNANQSVAKSLQLIAGRTAQEFNRRKKRQGAFWQDRYHATAIDTQDYLMQCLVYIDLNMVRAGVVKHPGEWVWSGFHEIQSSPKRYQKIDQERLSELVGLSSINELKQQHLIWIEEALLKAESVRDEKWTKSLAVGRQKFAESYLDIAGINANHRQVYQKDDCYVAKENCLSYNDDLSVENCDLRRNKSDI